MQSGHRQTFVSDAGELTLHRAEEGCPVWAPRPRVEVSCASIERCRRRAVALTRRLPADDWLIGIAEVLFSASNLDSIFLVPQGPGHCICDAAGMPI